MIRVPILVGAEYMGTTSGASSIRVDTSDATAVAGDLRSGKIAYAGGQRLTGAMPELGAQTITPSTLDQTIAAGQYVAGEQTIKGDPNLLPQNIAYGVNLFGVDGSLLGAGKLKNATGDVTIAAFGKTIAATGLSFDPVVVCIKLSSTNSWFFIDIPDGISASGNSDITFAHEDGSFTLTASQILTTSECIYTWYALGV